MTSGRRLLSRLESVLTLEWGVDDSPAGYRYACRCVARLVSMAPGLARETGYLRVMRRTGGLHAHDDFDLSFVLFGFGEPGYGFTSFHEGSALDGHFFRFGDLMLPSFDENVVLAFDLRSVHAGIYSTPGSRSEYQPYAEGFAALLDKVAGLARVGSPRTQ